MKLFKVAFPYNSYGMPSAAFVYANDEKEALRNEDVAYAVEECTSGFVVVTEVPMKPGVVAWEMETNV